MKKLLLFATNILLIFTLIACNTQSGGQNDTNENSTQEGNSGDSETADTIKIGVNLELSGAASVWGIPQKEAIEMLANEINENGGINGKKLELIIYDNESSETQALVVAKKLVEQDKVSVMIGGGTTPTTMPIIPYLEQNEIPLVSVGSGDEITSPVEDRYWVFKTPIDNEEISISIIEYLKKHDKNNVAFMGLNNAYGDSGLKTFEKVASENDINIVTVEKFGATDKDMKPQLTKIKEMNPDAIVVWAIPPSASIVNKNYWELKMENTLIYPAGAGSNTFIELAGEEAVNGTLISAGKVWVSDELSDDDPQKEIITKYVQDYESKTGNKASPIDGMAYDALLLISKAIENAGDDITPVSIRDELEQIQDFPGVTGIYNLSSEDHQGLSPDDALMVQIKDGEFVIPE